MPASTASNGLASEVTEPSRNGCYDVSGQSAHLTLTGHLRLGTFSTEGFPGQPERVYLIELPHRICVSDGGEFADPNEHFSSVQVSAPDDRLFSRLRLLIGRQITVSGEAFAAHTRHHYRPLVLIADNVSTSDAVSQGRSNRFDTIGTVQAFYRALATGRYEFAGSLVVPSKRASGPLSVGAMSRYYSTFERPLRLTAIRRVGATSVIANYSYVLPGGRTCSGEAVVDLSHGENGSALIERIRTVGPC